MKYAKLEIRPETLDNIEWIDKKKLVRITTDEHGKLGINGKYVNEVVARGGGKFRGRAIYLSDTYDYVLGLDDEGMICLLVLKKQVF